MHSELLWRQRVTTFEPARLSRSLHQQHVKFQRTDIVIKIPRLVNLKATQLETLEDDLMKSVEELQARRRIDEILDPSEEKCIGEATIYEDDDAIVAEIQRRQAIRSGKIVEVESDEEPEEDNQSKVSTTDSELIGLCTKLEAACIARVDADSSLDFIHDLRGFRAVLQREEMQKAKQTTLDSLWGTK